MKTLIEQIKAQEIVENLGAALEMFAGIEEGLNGKGMNGVSGCINRINL